MPLDSNADKIPGATVFIKLHCKSCAYKAKFHIEKLFLDCLDSSSHLAGHSCPPGTEHSSNFVTKDVTIYLPLPSAQGSCDLCVHTL